MTTSKFFTIIQIILTIALVVFIGLKAGEFFGKVDWHVVSNNWPSIVLSGVIFGIGYGVMAWHWQTVCQLVTPKTGKKPWLAFLASQPYKYLPTSIFTFSSRATFASKLGMSFKHSTEAQVIENFNLIGTSLALGGLIMLAYFYPIFALMSILPIALVALLLWRLREFTVPKLQLKINLRHWLRSVLIVSLGWTIMGLAFFALTLSLEQRFEPLLTFAANNLATGLGIVAVFAPGGIGIRELVFYYLGFASVTIVVWRFTTFVVDIVLGLFAGILITQNRK